MVTQQYRITLPMLETAQVQSLGQKITWRREWQPAQYYCLGNSVWGLISSFSSNGLLCGYSNTCAPRLRASVWDSYLPANIQLRWFLWHVSWAAQIQHLSNSLFESSNFPSSLTSVVKSSILGAYSWHSPVLYLSSFPVNYQVLFILFSLNIQSPLCILTPATTVQVTITLLLVMFTRSSNYNSRLPRSCPVFSPESYSWNPRSGSLSILQSQYGSHLFWKDLSVCLWIRYEKINSINGKYFLKNIKMDPT